MKSSKIAKCSHQRNKSKIVKLVREMFDLEKCGNGKYRKKLVQLDRKDEELVRDVIKKLS